jgi:hypothetical protein
MVKPSVLTSLVDTPVGAVGGSGSGVGVTSPSSSPQLQPTKTSMAINSTLLRSFIVSFFY